VIYLRTHRLKKRSDIFASNTDINPRCMQFPFFIPQLYPRAKSTHFIDYSSMTVAGEVFTLDESLPRGRSSWWTEHSNFRTDVSDEARGRRRPREGENLTAIKIRIALETSRRSTRRRSSSLSLSPSLLAPSCTRRVGVPFRDLRRFNRAINLTPCCNNTSRRAAAGK